MATCCGFAMDLKGPTSADTRKHLYFSPRMGPAATVCSFTACEHSRSIARQPAVNARVPANLLVEGVVSPGNGRRLRTAGFRSATSKAAPAPGRYREGGGDAVQDLELRDGVVDGHGILD